MRRHDRTHMRSPRTLRTLAPALALLLAVGACGDEADTDGSEEGETASSTAETSDEKTSEEVEAVPSGAACLEGTWVADNDFFLAAIREFGDEVKNITGTVKVTFTPDGATRTVYDGWRIEAVVGGRTSTIERDGLDTGTYTAMDSTLSITESTMGSQLVVTVMGAAQHMPAAPVDYADVTYTCSGSEALITTPDGALKLSR